MKSYSKFIAAAAVIAAGFGIQTQAGAQGWLSTVTSALGSGTTAAATTGSAASSTASSALSTAAGALSSIAGSASSTASAVSSVLPAVPSFSSPSATSYATSFSSLCSQAISAYQTKDYLKAAQLYPQVQSAYAQGSTLVKSLSPGDASKLTDWKSSLMSAVTSAAGALAK